MTEKMHMHDKVFLDTNVLVYLYDKDKRKKQIAKSLLGKHPVISTQVLNEFNNISLKKLHIPIDELTLILSTIMEYTTLVLFDERTIIKALEIKKRYQFGYYDSLILATAIENDCTLVYSEDMQHNQMIFDQLKIHNPFLP